MCYRYSSPATRRGGKASRPRLDVNDTANVRSISAQSIIVASRTSGCCMLICSSSLGRNSSPDCGCEGFGPMQPPKEFARKQVLAEPYLANPAPINPKNLEPDQRLAHCSGRTMKEAPIRRSARNSQPCTQRVFETNKKAPLKYQWGFFSFLTHQNYAKSVITKELRGNRD